MLIRFYYSKLDISMKEKNLPEISIIIPLYQSEKTIANTIKSVILQSFTDWELLVIDDGSTDNGAMIAKEFADSDDRIKVFHQANSGRSAARNKGIQLSQGNWIFFLDADDALPTFALDTLFDCTNNVSADLISGNRAGVRDLNRKRLEPSDTYIKAIVNPWKTAKNNCDYYDGLIERAVWGKLYRATVIKNKKITFIPTLVFGEDALFNLLFLEAIEKVIIIDCGVYLYNDSEPSTTRSFDFSDIDHLEEFFEVGISVLNDLKKKNIIDKNDIAVFLINELLVTFGRAVRWGKITRPMLKKFNYLVRKDSIKTIISQIDSPELLAYKSDWIYIKLFKCGRADLAILIGRFFQKI